MDACLRTCPRSRLGRSNVRHKSLTSLIVHITHHTSHASLILVLHTYLTYDAAHFLSFVALGNWAGVSLASFGQQRQLIFCLPSLSRPLSPPHPLSPTLTHSHPPFTHCMLPPHPFARHTMPINLSERPDTPFLVLRPTEHKSKNKNNDPRPEN